MSAKDQHIRFHFLHPVYLPNRSGLKDFIKALFKAEKTPFAALSYIFCDDSFLLTMNKQYLNHNAFTDIITFPLHAPGKPVVADAYISVPRAKENAQLFKSTQTREIHRLIFHGALHLCGYADKKPEDRLAMTQREDAYLQRYFVPRETI